MTTLILIIIAIGFVVAVIEISSLMKRGVKKVKNVRFPAIPVYIRDDKHN